MLKSLPLRLVYQNRLYRSENDVFCSENDDFRGPVTNFLTGRPVDSNDLTERASSALRRFSLTEEENILDSENILTAVLLLKLMHSDVASVLSSASGFLYRNQDGLTPFRSVFIALLRHLTGMPVHSVHPVLLEGGGCPIDLHEYCPRQAQPYAPYHAEFGVLLSLLARLTENVALKTAVLRIAKWHLNTLDVDFSPLVGLFSQEKHGSLFRQSIWNYLFFYSLTDLFGESEYSDIVRYYAGFLESSTATGDTEVSPLFPLIEELINRLSCKVSESGCALSETIYDPSCALVGKRNPGELAVCTLHGGYTGLGCLRSGDVRILSYGPQHSPLEDCRGFGIEGNRLSDHGLRRSSVEVHPAGFSLKGCVRLVDRPLDSPETMFRFGKLSGIWFETEQELRSSHFSLKTAFLGFDGWEGVAFSFFVKASRCSIGSHCLHPRTLHRYEGEVCEVLLEGKEGQISLASNHQGMMRAIPLGGGHNFWGADFLVAYILGSEQSRYVWDATLKRV